MSDYVNFKEKRSRGNFVGYVIASGLSFRTRTGNTRGQRNTWGQRIFDCVTAAGLFIFCLPILVLAALAIKIESPRSAVFFTQIRYGYAGKPFRMIKLRTMVPNAEQLKSGLVASSVDRGAGFKVAQDPRITKTGRILRGLYIDEIPQFINVILGQMSIVGPRANSYSPESYEPWQKIRLQVNPGITGTWQISRNKPYGFDERCRMDLDYISSKSLLTDIVILFQTVRMLLTSFSGE